MIKKIHFLVKKTRFLNFHSLIKNKKKRNVQICCISPNFSKKIKFCLRKKPTFLTKKTSIFNFNYLVKNLPIRFLLCTPSESETTAIVAYDPQH